MRVYSREDLARVGRLSPGRHHARVELMPVFTLYHGSIKATLRLYQGSIKALSRQEEEEEERVRLGPRMPSKTDGLSRTAAATPRTCTPVG
jgi:hypothetical protein